VPWTAQRSRTAKRRLRLIEARSVTKAMMRISAPQRTQVKGKIS